MLSNPSPAYLYIESFVQSSSETKISDPDAGLGPADWSMHICTFACWSIKRSSRKQTSGSSKSRFVNLGLFPGSSTR